MSGLKLNGCVDVTVRAESGVEVLWERLSRLSVRSIDVDLMLRRLLDIRNRMMMVRSFEYDWLLG